MKRKSKKRKGRERPARRATAASPVRGVALFAAFAILGLLIYAPALGGAFVADDQHYVQDNPYVHEPLANLGAILDPTSVLALVVENYAPVHVLLHAFEWQLFGPRVTGYHVVNVLVHALASVLLVALFRRTGIPELAALAGGAFFFVHPANVEAVAWINQLKTSSAMALCLGAVLAHPRRPGWGTLLFALALLAKPTAAVALFFTAALGWSAARSEQQSEGAGAGWRWPWLGTWALGLGLFAVAEFAAFGQTAGQAPALYEEWGTRIRSVFAIALRYLVMSTTSTGLSAFHEPEPADSFVDPWWLASLPVLAALLARAALSLRARRVEGAWWVWAAVSFAPICGVIPLPFPMADRYLYFMLPGLIGGALLAAQPWALRWLAGGPEARRKVLALAASLWIAIFAFRSWDRAHVWVAPVTLMADVERNYPNGTAAKTNGATRAAQVGDAVTAVALLRAAHERGYNRLDHLLLHPYAPIEGHPDFEALKREWAREWIERLAANPNPSQIELQLVAQAHLVRGDLEEARRTVEAAIAKPGPITENLEHDLREIERAIRFSKLEQR